MAPRDINITTATITPTSRIPMVMTTQTTMGRYGKVPAGS